MQTLEEELKHKHTEVENIKDAVTAVEEFGITADDDEKLRISIGECFVEVTTDVAEERLAGVHKYHSRAAEAGRSLHVRAAHVEVW